MRLGGMGTLPQPTHSRCCCASARLRATLVAHTNCQAPAMADGPLGCRRRSQQRYLLSNQASPPSSPSGLHSRSPCSRSLRNSPSRIAISPRSTSPSSIRHRLHFCFSRTMRRLAVVSIGIYGSIVSSRFDGISRLCAIYSFTGILFTVSERKRLRI
jgi:hypothetical protein